MYETDTQRRERAAAERKIRSIKTTTPIKDQIKEPEMRSQELNCWHIANQFALALPLLAKYTIAAAAEAPCRQKSQHCLHNATV